MINKYQVDYYIQKETSPADFFDFDGYFQNQFDNHINYNPKDSTLKASYYYDSEYIVGDLTANGEELCLISVDLKYLKDAIDAYNAISSKILTKVSQEYFN